MNYKKFVVIYDWGHDVSVREFDTIEEAFEDRLNYSEPEAHPIYQLVKESVVLSLPDSSEVTIPIR